jgi:hypothetical protein
VRTGLAGDVNVFWNDIHDPDAAEVDIMIARKRSACVVSYINASPEEEFRRLGLATEALQIVMQFGALGRPHNDACIGWHAEARNA